MDRSEPDDPEERDHFKAVCAAFFNYQVLFIQVDSLIDIARMERNFAGLPQAHLDKLKIPYQSRIEQLKSAVFTNYALMSRIVHPNKGLFPCKSLPNGGYVIPNLQVAYKDVTKLRSTIRQCVRDWSELGAAERSECYSVVIGEVQSHFPSPTQESGEKVSVLTPGAGLGRLSFEFARLGYASQGNEFSYYMLLASDFILNKTRRKNEYELYPFLHDTINVVEFADTLRVITIPDLCPSEELTEDDDFSMVAGEFVQVYSSRPGQWDCVVTCYFLDTANNVLLYIETILATLKPGGVWVNFGPLLYHYAEQHDQVSIDLSWEEVRHAILSFGFSILKEEVRESHYDNDAKSMLQVTYKCVFFTAVKPRE